MAGNWFYFLMYWSFKMMMLLKISKNNVIWTHRCQWGVSSTIHLIAHCTVTSLLPPCSLFAMLSSARSLHSKRGCFLDPKYTVIIFSEWFRQTLLLHHDSLLKTLFICYIKNDIMLQQHSRSSKMHKTFMVSSLLLEV